MNSCSGAPFSAPARMAWYSRGKNWLSSVRGIGLVERLSIQPRDLFLDARVVLPIAPTTITVGVNAVAAQLLIFPLVVGTPVLRILQHCPF